MFLSFKIAKAQTSIFFTLFGIDSNKKCSIQVNFGLFLI